MLAGRRREGKRGGEGSGLIFRALWRMGMVVLGHCFASALRYLLNLGTVQDGLAGEGFLTSGRDI